MAIALGRAGVDVAGQVGHLHQAVVGVGEAALGQGQAVLVRATHEARRLIVEAEALCDLLIEENLRVLMVAHLDDDERALVLGVLTLTVGAFPFSSRESYSFRFSVSLSVLYALLI